MSKPKQPARRDQPRQQLQPNIQFVREEYRGLLPPPNMMEEYRRIIPNLPEKLIEMAENETKHRHRLERRVISAEIWLEVFRIVAALVALSLILGAAYLFMTNGHPTAAATVAGIAVAVVGIFITKRVIAQK